MQPVEFADKHLRPYKKRGVEIVPETCPYCQGGQRNDKYSFALNVDKKTYNCKRGKCSVSGHFVELCRDFGEETEKRFNISRKKKYKPPKVEVKSNISSKTEEYLRKRGFSRETWEKRGVFENERNIAFPYYQDGELVLVKYRPPRKVKEGESKGWREPGGKPVFWGMDDCNPEKPLIITEGEMDTLALVECGLENVVSVPSGNKDLNCIKECWGWLEQFQKVIIWGDNDEPGKEMVDELVRRLGEWRCYVVESPHKDANVHLFLEGKESTIKAVEDARAIPIKGLLRLSEVRAFDITECERAASGFKGIDHHIGGFVMGQVSIWTGENGSGKSTFLGQILTNAIEQGHAVCAYSGELTASLYKYWTELQMAGKDFLSSKHDPIRDRTTYYVPPDLRDIIEDWYHDKYFLYDAMSGPSTTEDILRTFEQAARRYRCKVFLIDNLMTTVFDGSERDYYRQQSEFIGRVKDFSHKYNVHSHIVAHPRKTNGQLTKADVSGSGDITNRADNVFGVERVQEEEKEKEGLDYDAMVHVLKSRLTGKQDIHIRFRFSEMSKRFWMLQETEERLYGWIYEGAENEN